MFKKLRTNLTKKKYKLSVVDILFVIGFICIFLAFLMSWYDAKIPIVDIPISKDFMRHWIPLATLVAFLITLYKQVTLESRLDVQKKAVIGTNNKICSGLIDDINAIITASSNKTSFQAINLLRERIEIHLEYCQSCCSGEDKEEYANWARALNRYEHQLRGKIKTPSKVSFDESTFVKEMREFKRFLIKKDNLILN